MVVVTKLDKLGKNQQRKAISRLRPGFQGARMLGFSSVSGEGKKEVLELIQQAME